MRFSHLLLHLIICHFVILPSWAVQPPQALTQGGFFIGQTHPKNTIKFNGKTIHPTPSGTFILGFDRNAEPEQTYQICQKSTCQSTTLLVTPRTFKTQPIKGVANKHVNPDPKQVARARADSTAIAAARKKSANVDDFSNLFAHPVTGTTTGVFGSRRTYNGEERSWHKGLDFAAPTGTPVLAPAPGTVVLARDTFFNGNLIILDHGAGLTSLYAHLNKMHVKPGDKVKEGQKIGEVGTTGRSTGPHLHWGVNWGTTALDPALFLRK